MKIDCIHRFLDDSPRSCAFQMAIDESIFRFTQKTGRAVVRFYQWGGPAITFGYSEPYPKNSRTKAVRRFTGGGLVEHGEDETFLLTLPAHSKPAQQSAEFRYRWIHEAIALALRSSGLSLEADKGESTSAPGPCFSHPVRHDLIRAEDGTKIVGGAQRRNRGCIIHQGSLRLPQSLRIDPAEWRNAFLAEMSGEIQPLPETTESELLGTGEELSRERYTSDEWNHRR